MTVNIVLEHLSKNITIAVLPFKLTTDDERLTNLFEGFTEDLISNFSKFVGLLVISQYSTQGLNFTTDKAKIKNLNADFLIIGSVRHRQNKVRISIQLVKTINDSVVYVGEHNESFESLLEIQDNMIQEIVSVLRQELNYNILSHSYKKNNVNLDAYENWLRGMDSLKKGSSKTDEDARKYFEAALQIDEHYALAYSGISLSYFNEWSCQLWERWDISEKGAHKYALKAIENDKNDYSALAVLGRTYLYKEEFEKAEHCVRKSLRMNPNDVSNLILISYTLAYLGYTQEAIDLFEKATELNPLHKENYYPYGAMYYMEAGNYEKSIELIHKTDIRKSWTDYPAFIAATYYHMGDYEKVWKHWNIYLELFEKNIYSEKTDLDKKALEWMHQINPYKGHSKLYEFWDYIKRNKGVHFEKKSENTEIVSSASWLFQDDNWSINYQNKHVLLKNTKGLQDLSKLLSDPEKEFHCMDLMEAVIDEKNPTESIDQKAKSNYLKRIKELQIEIENAEELNNSIEANKLREEYDSILDHLSQSLGLAGKTRKVGSTVEKARTAVTWRIRNTIKKLEKIHPPLSKHLSSSIKTGTYCSYKPEYQIDWEL